MNGPAPVKPLRFIVEATTTQIQELVQPLLRWLTPRDPPVPATPAEDEAEAPEPPAARGPDPPVRAPGSHDRPVRVPRPVVALPAVPQHGSPPRPKPTLPAALAKYRLGALCPKPGHAYEHSGYSLKRGSHCVRCERERAQQRRGTPPAPPARPELPGHLASTCFLSPIACDHPEHRYRGTPWTLRFVDTEQCCHCLAGTTTLHGAASAAD